MDRSRDPQAEFQPSAPDPPVLEAPPVIAAALEQRSDYERLPPFPLEEEIDEASAIGQHFEEQSLQSHERTRSWFALGLLGLFGFTTVFPPIASLTDAWGSAKEAMQMVQPPVIFLVGGAISYYFLIVLRGHRG
jgi:hypothetical protein